MSRRAYRAEPQCREAGPARDYRRSFAAAGALVIDLCGGRHGRACAGAGRVWYAPLPRGCAPMAQPLRAPLGLRHLAPDGRTPWLRFAQAAS